MIRPVIAKDADWLLKMAVECHPPPIAHVKPEKTAKWIEFLLTSPHIIGLRGEVSAGFAAIISAPWDDEEVYANLLHLFRKPGGKGAMEAYMVLYAIGHRAFQRGASKFYIVSTGADLTPFARRLGAKPCGSSHILRAA